jgi:hypothetical protein
MYVGCLKVGCVCTRADPLQAAYTSVTSLKKRKQQSSKQGREYWYGRPESLKDSDTYRNSKKEIKPIKAPKKNIP